ncbi:MAG TPA: hypothetical protein ENJ50_00625 [Planctomycetaceae bacterium]|nr:hypothetical protein [Planctomycetaceae bacterium]
MLAEAKKLSEKSDRTDKENDRLKNLLAEIDHQVRLGRVLGYFDSQRAEKMLAELEQIRKRTQGGKSGEGFFDYIKELFEEWAKEWSDK